MINKILLPTDGSELSEKTIEYAINFAKEFDATIVVLHVYAVTSALQAGFRRGAALLESMRKEIEEDASEIVSAVALRVSQHGLMVEALLIEGSPADGILRAIADAKPDIVIMGSRGAGGLPGLPLGSVAERVVRHSIVPVLVVK